LANLRGHYILPDLALPAGFEEGMLIVFFFFFFCRHLLGQSSRGSWPHAAGRVRGGVANRIAPHGRPLARGGAFKSGAHARDAPPRARPPACVQFCGRAPRGGCARAASANSFQLVHKFWAPVPLQETPYGASGSNRSLRRAGII